MLKKITGFSGYSIDETGKIYSYIGLIHANNGQFIGGSEAKVKKITQHAGYNTVRLRRDIDCKHILIGVHRLLAKEFIPNPQNRPYVCHKNGVRNDNRLDNLYWGTPQENVNDKKRHGTQLFGEKIYKAILNDAKVKFIKILYSFGFHYKFIANCMKVRPNTIQNIIHGRAWKHIILPNQPITRAELAQVIYNMQNHA
jgi:hypothetical protein